MAASKPQVLYYAVNVFQGVDGAGLPPLPEMLASLDREPSVFTGVKDIPVHAGSRAALESLLEDMASLFRRSNYLVEYTVTEESRPFWARPLLKGRMKAVRGKAAVSGKSLGKVLTQSNALV